MAWPSSAAIGDLETCTSCGILVYADTPGTLQVLTRRQGTGVGDGVNIEENVGIGADYRGQRYTYQEAILHVPGLHIFPGNKEVYPAEYHIHMQTLSNPPRALTLVLPATHRTPDSTAPGLDYFAAIAAQPDPSATRPTLSTLLVPGTPMLQYQGPDIRNRTKANPTTDNCNPDVGLERQFLLVLGDPLRIRASDLERIPREGSPYPPIPANLPAPGIQPTTTLPRDRLRRCVVLASPGIISNIPTPAPNPTPTPTTELQCKPLQVVNGVDVIDVSGQAVDIRTLLGLPSIQGKSLGATANVGVGDVDGVRKAKKQVDVMSQVLLGFGILIGTGLGLWLAEKVYVWIWECWFNGSDRLKGDPIPGLKWVFYVIVVLGAFIHQVIAPYINN